MGPVPWYHVSLYHLYKLLLLCVNLLDYNAQNCVWFLKILVDTIQYQWLLADSSYSFGF
jgi:hypothetical protein